MYLTLLFGPPSVRACQWPAWQRAESTGNYADTRIRIRMCCTVIGAGRSRVNGVGDGAMTAGNASNWEMQVDKRRSLSLERDMARGSSVRSSNVAALTAWRRSSDGGTKTGKPQVAWSPRLVVSLGIFTAKLTAATADRNFATDPKLSSDMFPATTLPIIAVYFLAGCNKIHRPVRRSVAI